MNQLELYSQVRTPNRTGVPGRRGNCAHSRGGLAGAWRLPHRGLDQVGAASVAQTVLIAPVLLFTLMAIVQFALMFHARNVAEQAAQDGAAQGRALNGTAAQARAATLQTLSVLDVRTLQDRAVSVSRTQTTASVTVTGTVISLVPLVHLGVSESATGPVERYVPPEQDHR